MSILRHLRRGMISKLSSLQLKSHSSQLSMFEIFSFFSFGNADNAPDPDLPWIPRKSSPRDFIEFKPSNWSVTRDGNFPKGGKFEQFLQYCRTSVRKLQIPMHLKSLKNNLMLIDISNRRAKIQVKIRKMNHFVQICFLGLICIGYKSEPFDFEASLQFFEIVQIFYTACWISCVVTFYDDEFGQRLK
ncbi:importin subunit alpha-8 [Striga asiatica]|uniref:Importin subunit alpha-8 n=1 Tax=Striga asiatica TaxID=4170 RepID=A0A5A7R857_STRAF|nr:importin subunit alpha-8 [Striga asiatica]